MNCYLSIFEKTELAASVWHIIQIFMIWNINLHSPSPWRVAEKKKKKKEQKKQQLRRVFFKILSVKMMPIDYGLMKANIYWFTTESKYSYIYIYFVVSSQKCSFWKSTADITSLSSDYKGTVLTLNFKKFLKSLWLMLVRKLIDQTQFFWKKINFNI